MLETLALLAWQTVSMNAPPFCEAGSDAGICGQIEETLPKADQVEVIDLMDGTLMEADPVPKLSPVPKPVGNEILSEEIDRIIREAARKPTAFTVLAGGLRTLHGKSERTAFKFLGYPDRKMTISGRTIYTWQSYSPDRGGGGNLTCSVKIVTSRSIVIDTDFRGNAGACETYARSFNPRFHIGM